MRTLHLFAVVFIVSISLASSGPISTSVLIASGGQGLAVAGSYTLNVSVGQPIVGAASSSAYQMCYGYWCNPLASSSGPSGYRVYLPLIVLTRDSNLDSFEPDNAYTAARPIGLDGTLQRHNFYPANDQDWVQLQVGPGTYIIATSNLITNTDTVLHLFASNGVTQLGMNDDCTIYTRASCLTWVSNISTMLYLQITPYDNTSIGPDRWYSLSVVQQ